jgi:hypothetical protein
MEKDDDVLTSVLTTIANENDYVVTFGDTEVDKNKNDDVQKIVRRKTMNFAEKNKNRFVGGKGDFVVVFDLILVLIDLQKIV